MLKYIYILSVHLGASFLHFIEQSIGKLDDFPLAAANWGGNSSGQANNGSNNTQQQWNNTAQRPPTSQADSKLFSNHTSNDLV